MTYDDIFYEYDSVLPFFYVGEGRETARIIVGIKERPSKGNRMVAVSATKVEMHERICVV